MPSSRPVYYDVAFLRVSVTLYSSSPSRRVCCGVVAILVVAVDVCAERRQSSIAVHTAGLLIAFDMATWNHNTTPAKLTTVSRWYRIK